jgi:thioredoxin-related protein
MISRRQVMLSLAGGLTLPATALLSVNALAEDGAKPILTDDGLYKQSWFLESFLELADDLAGAARAGKRFAVIWELRGCPYCKETHFVNFARPDISSYIRQRFDILQLNLIGAREVIDFDGEKLSENRLAKKYGVHYSPTFQFFPETAAGLAPRKPREREVARAQGYLDPAHFLGMFSFVAEKAYEQQTLRNYLRAKES